MAGHEATGIRQCAFGQLPRCGHSLNCLKFVYEFDKEWQPHMCAKEIGPVPVFAIMRLAAHALQGQHLSACLRPQALRVFLEADGNLRSNPQWRCLKPKVLTPIQATNRLVRTLVGVRKTAPTPSEVVQPALVGRDIYRMLHENVQQLRGSFKHSPLNTEVSRVLGFTV